MGINFGDMSGVSPASVQQVLTEEGELTLDLGKGITIDLAKVDPGLQHVMFGAGWDSVADLDISAFLLNGNNKALKLVYYTDRFAPGITLSEDNRTGEGSGDDETMDIDLNQVPAQIAKIVFVVTIYEAEKRKQTFKCVSGAYCRLVNTDTQEEICRFRLTEDYSFDTGIIVAELNRTPTGWTFTSIGEGVGAQDLKKIYSTRYK